MVYSPAYYAKHKEAYRKYAKKAYAKSKEGPNFFNITKKQSERSKKLARTVDGRLKMSFLHSRTRAKNHNLSFDIDFDFVKELYQKQQGRCKLSNIEFSFENVTPFSPSIDRISSDKGYTRDNIRLVCLIVNLALNNFGDEAFFTMCEATIKHVGVGK